MDRENRCPKCGAQLSGDAPEGLCPGCLLKAVAATPEKSEVTLAAPRIEGPGTTIGRYELLDLLGEGGMGLVYLAEQKEPVRRKVALKIIKPGMDSKQVVARFEAERQALALLDHPNIAHVFDAGCTETGRPYFVMEHVKGLPITSYCDQNKLTIEQRLRLFEQVCEAVHHAHQKGIIHRDLKPSNILVSVHGDRATPKIIDFGIAKAITSPLTDKTYVTFQGQLLGTPEYMSPEQVDLATQDIDTRSDIYSLGIVLYELLAGVLPFESESFARAGLAEIQQTIREQEPASPSIRLTNLGERAHTIAASRGTQAVPLARRLHRELEWIPLKAMRKDRCRRYKSASEMADDIRNYLNGNPLLAGPETTIYRVQKFVHKHAGSVITSALVAGAIVLGLVVSTTMYLAAEKARTSAAIARDQAEQAQEAEHEQRKLADNRAEELRRSFYVNSIQLADAKHLEGNARRVHELLDSSPEDLRGWEWHRLNRISDQSLMTIPGQHAIYATLFSPDGKRVISAGDDAAIRVCDSVTGGELKVFRGHEATVWSLAISPDGRQIASGSFDKTIKVWDAETGREVTTIRGHKGEIGAVAFDPTGKTIVSVAWGERVARVWDIQTGTEITTLSGQNDFDCVAFSPDGKRIISGDDAGDIRYWDAGTGKQVMTVPAHGKAGISNLVFSPNGKRVVSVGGWDRTLKVWDTQTGTLCMTIPAHTAKSYSASFSPDGKRIASGCSDNTIKIWDAETGEELRTLRGHEQAVHGVAFSPDGGHLASGSEDGTIKVWDTTIDQEVARLQTQQDLVCSISYSPDGRRIAVASWDWMVKIYDVETGTGPLTLHERQEGRRRMAYLAFSPDGKRIAYGGADDIPPNVWDSETGEGVAIPKDLIGPIAFSPDGKHIACGHQDKTVRIWSSTSGREVLSLSGHEARVVAVAFSPDGKRIASGDRNGITKVWDAGTGVERVTLDGHRGYVGSLTFSPDGGRIASASFDLTTRIWDASTGKELMTLRGLGDIITGVRFSPDGKRIVTGSRDGTVKLWDVTTGDELLTLRAYPGVHAVAFSPDGKTVAAGLEDGSVAQWESQTTAGYRSWKTAEGAQNTVDELREKHGLYHEVIRELQDNATLESGVRKLAIQIANSRLWEDAEKLRSEVWETAYLADKDAEAYRTALEDAQKANGWEPNDPRILGALGAAQYRTGSYQEALKTLKRGEQIRVHKGDEPDPAGLAFRAMVLQQLGRADEAKATLEQLRGLLKDERFADDPEAKALLSEAEGVVLGQK
jgi:WD40 repeat protein/serine/threonine protein kinase